MSRTVGRIGLVSDLLRRGISPNYTDDGILVVNQKCIRPEGVLDLQYSRRHNEADREIPEDLLIQPGDILINSTGTGTLGRSCVVREVEMPMTWDSHVTLVRPRQQKVHHSYLGWTIESEEQRLIELSVGSTNQIELSRGTVFNLEISLPPLETQQRIADYLDRETAEIDAAVADLDKYVELLEKRLAHFVSESLGKDRFPLVPVFTLASLSAGAGITAESIEDSGTYPVYGGNGLRGYTEIFNQSVDRILIGRQGELCGNVHYAPGPLFASEHALVVDPRVSLNLIWFEHALRDLNLRTLSQASAQPGISASEVSRQRVHLPPREEQDAIAQLISNEVKQTRQIIGESLKLRDLLLKRRSVLITDVVTGRKKV